MLRLMRLASIRGYRSHTGVYGYHPKNRKPSFKLPKHIQDGRIKNSNFFRLVTAYRDNGHIVASINPTALDYAEALPELELSNYGLSEDEIIETLGLVTGSNKSETVANLINFLKSTYCGTLTADLSYLPSEYKEWLAAELEMATLQAMDVDAKKKCAQTLLESQIFEKFLATKFPTLKRYGLEGGESMLAFFLELLERPADVNTMVLGVAHRGRLNLLTGLLRVPPCLVFRKIQGGAEMAVNSRLWIGDVLSHLTCSDYVGNVHVTMLPNPSHLELVNPVSAGKTRGKQMRFQQGHYSGGEHVLSTILNIQVHGDAALAGQGVNQETLAFSNLPHFTVGGSIHLVVNNQVGFTTPGERGRSSRYASDLAKTNLMPTIHVNGNDPEAVMKAAKIALKYQRKFRKDIFVELHCYRRRGHNELDEPMFTNPQLYKIIQELDTTPNLYKNQLVTDGVLCEEQVKKWEGDYSTFLNKEFRKESQPPARQLQNQWSGMTFSSPNLTTWNTGLAIDTLRYIGIRSVRYPDSFNIHPHLEKTHVQSRLLAMSDPAAARLDWSTAESLAFGSLLLQGFNVRISGQDVGRATFSHRHVMLVNQNTNDTFIPMNDLRVAKQGNLEVVNSLLSEEAVLAFEYGLSVESPQTLVVWEAQFGDFVNGAQAVVDTHVCSGEAKWGLCSSLTMLLPHGYDGAGPEHSSCRVERFLQLTNSSETAVDGDDVNCQVAWPSTPAQYFHLLRRQQVRNFRTPLIVIAPKTLLRLADSYSRFEDFGPNTHFFNVLHNGSRNASKMVFTSGKHFYSLASVKPDNVVLVRLESLCPFPAGDLQDVIAMFPHVRDYIWSQEEPANCGAWTFVAPRFENLVGKRLRFIGRPTLSAPAYGLATLHKTTHEQVIKMTFDLNE